MDAYMESQILASLLDNARDLFCYLQHNWEENRFVFNGYLCKKGMKRSQPGFEHDNFSFKSAKYYTIYTVSILPKEM